MLLRRALAAEHGEAELVWNALPSPITASSEKPRGDSKRASSDSTSSTRSSRKIRMPSLLSQWATAYQFPLAKTIPYGQMIRFDAAEASALR